jgi:predicted RNA-binding Zn-ribbon protein involved in translation (DUF1610 family)
LEIPSLSIQILQYEFLGPISLEEWGPPMEKVVYLIMSRDKDKFDIVYVGDCEKTDDLAFFTGNSSYKCWMEKSLSEKSLYLAILPLFEASAEKRQSVISKIKTRYNPPCNTMDEPEKPDYKVRVSEPKFPCACCGADMKAEKILEKSTLYRCTSCGISDTKLNF